VAAGVGLQITAPPGSTLAPVRALGRGHRSGPVEFVFDDLGLPEHRQDDGVGHKRIVDSAYPNVLAPEFAEGMLIPACEESADRRGVTGDATGVFRVPGIEPDSAPWAQEGHGAQQAVELGGSIPPAGIASKRGTHVATDRLGSDPCYLRRGLERLAGPHFCQRVEGGSVFIPLRLEPAPALRRTLAGEPGRLPRG
jgi:hypothetical protein